MRIFSAPVLVAGLGLLLAARVAGAQVTPCTEGCIEVSASSPDGTFSSGQTFQTTISYLGGPADKGLDDEAAIAFSMSIPSLLLANCDNPTADGLTNAFTIPGEVDTNFRVVVENTTCKDDNKPCLCPGAGQQRADYINVVIFSPKTLPEQGQEPAFVTIPNGPILNVGLTVGSPTSSSLTLHLYNEADAGSPPTFAARASVGDKAAVDDTVNRTTNTSNVKFNDGTVQVSGDVPCLGDCGDNCEVGIGDLQIGLNMFFDGTNPQDICPEFGPDGETTVGIGQLQLALNNFFGGCPPGCIPGN